METLGILADQAALRLRRLQALVTDVGVGGLLLVSGQDGGYNAGATQVLGYLLQGESSRDALELTQLSDPWGDCILLVQPHALSAYVTNAEARDELRRLTTRHASNVRIFCPEMDESDDPDAFEEFKLGALVAMLRGCDSVGIPLATPLQEGRSATAAAVVSGGVAVLLSGAQLMAVERWPLLQAFGLDGVGRPGFFTMSFKVWDVNPRVQQVYASLDGRAVQVLLSQHCSSLRQQWLETLRVMTRQPAPTRDCVTERQMAELLQGFYTYGLMRPRPDVVADITMPPRIVFGVNTNTDGSVTSEVSIKELTVQSGSKAAGGKIVSSPLHMVVEGADPRSALRVARSYFLSTAALVRDAFADAEAEQEEGYSYDTATRGWACDDTLQLMRTYLALVEAATAVMNHFALTESATAQSAKGVAQETLTKCCGRLGLPPLSSSTLSSGSSGRLSVSLWQCDHANRVTGAAIKGSRQLKVVRLSLLDIHSSAHKGALLGGLVYADTFFDIPASTPTAALPARPPALMNLTAGIPALVAWPALGCEAMVQARAEHSLAGVTAMGAGSGGAGATAAGAAAAERRRNSARAAAARAVASAAAAARAAAIAAGATDVDAHEEEAAAPIPENGSSLVYVSDDEDADEAPFVDAVAWRPLGQQLTFGGGDECILLSACPLLAAVSGTITCFSSGFVFVGSQSGALWVCEFSAALEGIAVQELQGPKGSASLGEAIVFRGRSPACGFSPACHLTPDLHLALPLAAMAQGVQRHLMRVVLPAWKASCMDGDGHAHKKGEPSHAAVQYRKDPTASNPFPPALHAAHMHAAALLQPLQPEGTKKIWSEMLLQDSEVQEMLTRLDRVELRTTLAVSDPSVNSMLARSSATLPAAPSTQATAVPIPVAAASSLPTTVTAILTIVCGLPGADHALVADTLMGMSESPANTRIVWLQCPAGAPPSTNVQKPNAPGGNAAKAQSPAAQSGPLLLTQAEVNSALEAALSATNKSSPAAHSPSSSSPSPSSPTAAAAAPGLRHVVVVVVGFEGVGPVLQFLARSTVVQSNRAVLGTVVACVSCDGVWEDVSRGALMPGVAESCSEGLVDVVVIRGSAAEVALVQPLLAARNPSALIIRSNHAALSRARDDIMPLMLIVAPSAERLHRQQAASAARQQWVALPSTFTTRSTLQLQRGPLQAVHVTFTGLLDLGRLRAAFEQHFGMTPPSKPRISATLPLLDNSWILGSPDPAAGPYVVAVTGTVRLEAGYPAVDLYASHSSVLHSRTNALANASSSYAHGCPYALSQPFGARAGGELTFYGSALQPSALVSLLLRCSPHAIVNPTAEEPCSSTSSPSSPSRTTTATSTTTAAKAASTVTVTKVERAAIREAHLFDTLPEGYCFNGLAYYDAFGDKNNEHPDMESFVAAWVAVQVEEKRVKGEQAKALEAGDGLALLRVVVCTN